MSRRAGRGGGGGGLAGTPSANVCIATVDGRAYYTFSSLLKSLGVPHQDLLPGEAKGYNCLLLTTRRELPDGYEGRSLFVEDLSGNTDLDRFTVISRLHPELPDSLVIGVDPGGITGVAAVYRGIALSRTFSDSGSAIAYIKEILGFVSKNKTVRVGAGDRRGAQMAKSLLSLPGVRVELVNEAGTSSKARLRGGQRDAVAALKIARRRGRVLSAD